jgi:hypothetical protein
MSSDARAPDRRFGVRQMILKASQRGGSNQLAAHLLKTHDNEHVAVHELRGFSADDLRSRRDRREKDALIERHLDERQIYHTLAKQVKATHSRDIEQLHRDVA